MNESLLFKFVTESNRIEGIHREPTDDEMSATFDFLNTPFLEIEHLELLVSIYAPRHRLRDRVGLDVRVGNHTPPAGGPEIRFQLADLLRRVRHEQETPWQVHVEYETLHPFTDGNGRSGRALWLWMMQGEAPLGFLHHFYYQTLAEVGR
jgi:fido (protein-threonine AMPylation protein)